MGIYINHNSKGEALPYKGKADSLIADGATEVTLPYFRANLVCVVENSSAFDAALYCKTAHDYEITRNPKDTRNKRYLVYDKVEQVIQN